MVSTPEFYAIVGLVVTLLGREARTILKERQDKNMRENGYTPPITVRLDGQDAERIQSMDSNIKALNKSSEHISELLGQVSLGLDDVARSLTTHIEEAREREADKKGYDRGYERAQAERRTN